MSDDFEDVEFDMDLGEPSQELLAWAKEHIGETEEVRSVKLRELKEMIMERGEVTPHRTDDTFLLRFLRRKEFHLPKAYDLLVNYCRFREENPRLYKGLNPFKLEFLGDADIIQVLPYKEQTGRRIIIYKAENWKLKDYKVHPLIQATMMLMEMAVLEQSVQILGGIAIINLIGVGLAHGKYITPGVIFKFSHILVKSSAIKIHAVHIISESWVFAAVYKIIKPLLTQKLKDRIFFHGNDVESLHTHIDPKYLPERYGGMRPEYKYTQWVASLVWKEDIIKEMESLGYVMDREEIEAWRSGQNLAKNSQMQHQSKKKNSSNDIKIKNKSVS